LDPLPKKKSSAEIEIHYEYSTGVESVYWELN